MSQEILINITPQETRVAIIEQNAVQELHIERTRQRGIVSNIYLAKVVRVLPGMQSAFIDIGLDRAAFIHFNDLGEQISGTQIEKVLFEGQTLLVQVLKDPLGTKGARLTRQISIAGRNLVYLPQVISIYCAKRGRIWRTSLWVGEVLKSVIIYPVLTSSLRLCRDL